MDTATARGSDSAFRSKLPKRPPTRSKPCTKRPNSTASSPKPSRSLRTSKRNGCAREGSRCWLVRPPALRRQLFLHPAGNLDQNIRCECSQRGTKGRRTSYRAATLRGCMSAVCTTASAPRAVSRKLPASVMSPITTRMPRSSGFRADSSESARPETRRPGHRLSRSPCTPSPQLPARPRLSSPRLPSMREAYHDSG